MFLFLAKAAICDVGSDPIDKIQTSGVRGSDSDHVASKSNICISLYSGPRDSVLGKDILVISFSINSTEIQIHQFGRTSEHININVLNTHAPSMYFFACEMVRSGLHERMRSNLRKPSNVLLYEHGISSVSGFSDSYHVLHSFSFVSIFN